MNESEILHLLSKGEGDELEIKEDGNGFSSVINTACAMANTRGGHIVIGAKEKVNPLDSADRFKLVGIPKIRKVLSDAHNVGKQLEPPINTDFDSCDVSGGIVVVISVPKRKVSEMISLKDGSTWVAAHRIVQHRQVVEAAGEIRMVFAQGRTIYVYGVLKVWFSFRVLAFRKELRRQLDRFDSCIVGFV